MPTVENLISKLKGVQNHLIEHTDKFILDNEPEIIDLNKQQLLKGFDSLGRSLGDYRPMSVTIRQEQGLQVEHIDLRFTGQFQDSINLSKENETTYKIDASDSKWLDKLQPQKRFVNALGLNESSEKGVEKVITKELENELKKYFD